MPDHRPDVAERRIGREESNLGAEQGGVAGGFHDVVGELEESDAARAGAVDVVAERSGKPHAADIGEGRAGAFDQDAHAGGDGALGELQLADVGLGNGNAATEVERRPRTGR